MRRKRSTAAVWGDGFADDAWPSIAAVDRWASLDPDEYIRLFPRLARTSGDVADPVVDRLAGAVAVRAWRLHRGDPCALLQPGFDPASGARLEPLWFSPPSRWSAIFRAFLPDNGDPERSAARDAEALLFLDPLLASLGAGRRPSFTEADAMALAFHGGLHPAYLWPAAMPLHEIFAAAGWLGVLARGRRAFMPLPVAETLDAAIDGQTGRLRDGRLRFCQFTSEQWSAIAVAARRRRDGRSDPVRLTDSRRGGWRGSLGTIMPRWRRRVLRPVGPMVDRPGLPSTE